MKLSKTHSARTVCALVALVALAGCAAFHGVSRGEASLDAPDLGPKPVRESLFAYPWVWNDEKGHEVTFARWKGQPVLVTAIYTECHATCPRTVDKLRRLYESFRRQGHPPEFVLVTLDPKSDTPDRLLRFKRSQGLPDAWHLLTGGTPETQGLTDLLDIHVLNADSHIVHDARIVIFDEQGMPERTYSGWSLDDETATL